MTPHLTPHSPHPLQALFTKAVFLETIEAYKADGIDADAITYEDNSAIIELFEAAKIGLWATLSEECVVPKGSDEGFAQKLHQSQKGSAVMARVKGQARTPRASRSRDPTSDPASRPTSERAHLSWRRRTLKDSRSSTLRAR